MMFKKIFVGLIILLTCCGFVFAENNTGIIESLESGDSNISFADGFKGYCAEWGEHSAEEGQEFLVEDTSIMNNSNYLKTMFVFFYNQTQKDVYATQHMIWKFTDNKQFSRFNQTWYNQIVGMGDKYTIPDSMRIPVNDTHQWGFDFRMFVPFDSSFQNFFGYRFILEDIPKNPSVDVNNSTLNNTIVVPEYQNNESYVEDYDEVVLDEVNLGDEYTSNNTNFLNIDKTTGIGLWTLGCIIIILAIICIFRFK